MTPLVVLVLSIAFAAVPPLLYAFFIWWVDWYERESPRLVLLSFFWGAVVAAGIGAFLEIALNVPLHVVLSPRAADFLLVTFGAPPIEELAKGALLLLILHDTEFDNLTDGIVYGAMIGLGFSLSENVAYFCSAYADGGALVWLSNILFRSAFCCALHAIATALTGAAIGFAKFSRRRSRMVIVACGFSAAITLHVAWNGFLSLGDMLRTSTLAIVSIAGLPLVGAVLAALFCWSLHRERTIIRQELCAEAADGWLPQAHATMIANVSQRHHPGWLPAGIDQHHYIRTLTELAFRRHQLRHIAAQHRAHYTALVAHLRTTAQTLLGITAAGTPAMPLGPAPHAAAAPASAPPLPPPDSPPPR